MIDAEAENIIDAINRLSQAADKILDTEGLQPEEAFSGVRYFLGRYCDSPDGITVILDTDTLQSCRRRIISGFGDYYSAIEFLDIELDPIQNLAEYLDAQDHGNEAELLWSVVDFVDEIRQWPNRQSDIVPEQPFTSCRRPHQSGSGNFTQDQFLALFDNRNCKPHKARLLLNHILEVSGEKSVHTYYGALATECRGWFKTNEQDFASLLRNFLSVAGLDPALADNVRQTKLGKKVIARAQEKKAEIAGTRAKN